MTPGVYGGPNEAEGYNSCTRMPLRGRWVENVVGLTSIYTKKYTSFLPGSLVPEGKKFTVHVADPIGPSWPESLRARRPQSVLVNYITGSKLPVRLRSGESMGAWGPGPGGRNCLYVCALVRARPKLPACCSGESGGVGPERRMPCGPNTQGENRPPGRLIRGN